MILSVNMNQEDIFRIKAPTGLMFKIHSMYATTITPGDNGILVINESLEEQVTTIGNAAIRSGVIFEMEADVSQNAYFGLPVPEITKFISIATRTSTAFAVDVFINYEFKKATKTELLIEWFRKGR